MKCFKLNKIKGFTNFICILYLTMPSLAKADNYFDPNLLMQGSEGIDLSQFYQENTLSVGTYNLNVNVNLSPMGDYDIKFEKNEQGKVIPTLTPKLLRLFGVDVDKVKDLKGLADDTVISNIGQYIPNAKLTEDISQLTLNISIPQVYMKSSFGGEIPPELLDDGVTALLFNYMANFSRNKQTSSYTSNSSNVYVNLNGGANIGPWRLRTTYSYSKDSVKSENNVNFKNTYSKFSNTYIMRAINHLASTLKMGEVSTSGNLFDSIPMKGISLATNVLMRPSSMRGFAPVVSGVANSNATVTIRQNGNIIYQTFVAPGNFKIEDIPASGNSGDLEITIEEEDGSKRVTTQPYSSLPLMTREGQFEYEFAAGKYDGSIRENSKKSNFVLGTLVYGLPKNITLYGGALLAKDYSSLVVGTGFSLGSFGALSTDVTLSRAKLDNTYTGKSYRLRYSKSMLSTGTSFDLTTLRYSTSDYYSFSDFNGYGYNLKDNIAPWLGYRQRSSFQTTISQSLGYYGSIYLRGARTNYWGNDNKNTTLSVGYNTNIKNINFNVDYSIDRLKTANNNWPENHRLNFTMSMPFSVLSNAERFSSMSANYMLTTDNNHNTYQQVGITGGALDNKLAYGVYQQYNNVNSDYGGSLNTNYSGNIINAGLGYSYSRNNKNINANLSGGVVAHSKGITLSPLLGSNIAVMSAENARGGELTTGQSFDYFDNAVVTQLSEYNRNVIAIDVNTLPDDVTFTNTSMNVYPTAGAVLAKSFDTKVGYQVIFNLSHSTKKIPFGAVATLNTKDELNELPNNGLVDNSQNLYMSGLPNSGQIDIEWGKNKNTCKFVYSGLDKMLMNDSPIRNVNVICE